jgi:uncharacterized repeat protein (TIGR01451 family)
LTASFVAPADLALAIDDGVTSVLTGHRHAWTITVTNAGTNALAGVAVQSVASTGLDDVAWSCSATAGSSCGAAGGSGAIADAADVASGGRVSYLVDAYVRPDAPPSVGVSAASQVPPGYANASPADDSASDIDAVQYDLVFRDGFDPAP